MKNLRHGDICFIAKKVKTDGLKSLGKNTHIVSTGNTTGHTHILKADKGSILEVYEKGDNQVLIVKGTATITHPEHKPLTFDTGTWEIMRENEWDYFSKSARKVVD